MKYLVLLAGIGAMMLGQPARAQNILSSYTQTASVAASTASSDYRYTRHTISAGGRGGHSSTYYTWDPHLDQSTSNALPLPLGLAQQAASQSSFFGPTFSASASGNASLTNTPAGAVLSVSYGAATVVPTSLAAHQSVSVAAQPGGTFTFTITRPANVTVSTSGDPGGVFRLFGSGVGVLLGPLYGTSGPVSLDTPLTPGTYWVTNSLTYTSGVNMQLGTTTNAGATSTTWGFTMTVTPAGSDGPGGSDD